MINMWKKLNDYWRARSIINPMFELEEDLLIIMDRYKVDLLISPILTAIRNRNFIEASAQLSLAEEIYHAYDILDDIKRSKETIADNVIEIEKGLEYNKIMSKDNVEILAKSKVLISELQEFNKDLCDLIFTND